MKRGYLAFPLVLAVILFLSFFSILARAQDTPSAPSNLQNPTSQNPAAKPDKNTLGASDSE